MSESPDLPPFRPIPELDDAELAPSFEPATEADAETAEEAFERQRAFRAGVRLPLIVAGSVLAVALGTVLMADGDLAAQRAPEGAAEAVRMPAPVQQPAAGEAYTFRGLDIHPDRLHREYFAGAFMGDADSDSDAADHVADFRWRLEMFRKAYGVDDNFTVRVLDERTGKDLETFTLRALRDEYEATGRADWDAVNRERRTATAALRSKWQAYGIPRENIVIRWGYANQTLEARERDEPFLEHEAQLARRLGLSLLATEIGTVETFNQDHLVSSAGARSRYQMMPDILNMFDIERYELSTAGGRTVKVAEERHPLLSMEPYMMLVRAYSNAVGHELPGVSAYHTGVANIHKLYREYLRANPMAVRTDQHVSDAYMWGVTEGFEAVDAVSSFGPHSRVYVLKAYGALRGAENELVDPSKTAHVEMVQVRPGASLQLSRLLDALEPHERRLDWSYAADENGQYERFRALNPHIALPAARGGETPASGDLRLVPFAGDDPVRFFLPAGATEALQRVGIDSVRPLLVFDEDTFTLDPSEVTRTDTAYEALVRDIGQFGFSRANKARLERTFDQMNALARQNPDSRYRQTQAKIVRIHRMFWRTSAFDALMRTRETLVALDPLELTTDSVARAFPAPLF